MEINESYKKTLLAGGCFWCIEAAVRNIEGVIEVFSGYAGGAAETATYKDVGSGTTTHREVVEITYDPQKVSFHGLIQQAFKLFDPTDDGGQFHDRGYQYTTAVYYQNEEEKNSLESLIQELNISDAYQKPVVTKIEPVVPFYPAEEYHQKYKEKNPNHYERYYKGSGRKAYVEHMKSIAR